MLNRDTLKRHAGLVDRMATKLDLDLEEAALRGDVTISEIEDAVLSCTHCSGVGECERFLAESASAATTPGYCRNTQLFDALKIT